MYISSVTAKNFRCFSDEFTLTNQHIAVPDGINEGSGLTVLVGENGIGKSSLLDAIAMPLISYKADNLSLSDFTDIKQQIEIVVNANEEFTVKKTMSGDFQASGFKFIAKLREQNSTRYAVGTSVSDTYFISANATQPRAGSPDLRVAVDNPFAGPRFSENDYIFIDKNRIKTLESGTYSTSRFDRLMDNLNFLYLKANNNEPLELDSALDQLINAEGEPIANESLDQAFEYFEQVTGYKVKLNFVDDTEPYKKAFLGFANLEHAQLPLDKLGSGYQMFLALICQHKLSLQSGKKLIMLIDEVEMHLHPRLQKALVDLLLELSKTTQIILTSHSPELLKDLQKNTKHKINAIVREGSSTVINPIDKFVLPVPTVSETNYVAFGLSTIEYFIELYNHFSEIKNCNGIADTDRELGIAAADLVEWERDDGSSQQLSVYSCMRNKFHHPNNRLNDSKFDRSYESLAVAIEFLRQKIQE